MTSQTDNSYEERRRQHITYMREMMPQYLARLRWSREEIEAEQTRALRELLRHAVSNSLWYQKRLRHVDIERMTLAKLSTVPPMTKDDLMEHWDAIVTDPRCTLDAAEQHLATLTTDAYFIDDFHVIASGGTSGKRGVFVYDWHGWACCWLGSMRGMYEVLARNHLGQIASVSSHKATHATCALPQTFSDAIPQGIRAPVTLPLEEIVGILNKAQPSVLFCYASMLPVLCEEAKHNRLRIKPTLIWSTAEPLLPEIREGAEATWSACVMNTWAASESVGGTFYCRAGQGFHIGEDLNIIETVNEQGKAIPGGEHSAKIFLTNLYNRVMPLIRYEITDEFQVAEAPCSCGSAYLKVDDVQGRADDIFEYAGGIMVHPLNFRTLLGKESSIAEYQVRQTVRGAEIDVVGRPNLSLDSLRSGIEDRLICLGLSSPEIILQQVARIERQSSGKLKRFVSVPANGK